VASCKLYLPYRNVFICSDEDIDPVAVPVPVSEPQGNSSSDEFISVYLNHTPPLGKGLSIEGRVGGG
jgi:hypothetical protein